MNNTLILALILLQIYFAQGVYHKHLLSQENGAKCLDGSPPSIYVKDPGYETDPTKFMIFFQGGSWCLGEDQQTFLQDCEQRAKNTLGSSLKLQKTSLKSGILSVSQRNNPNFYDYTVIHVNYCDGTGYQGNLDQTLEINDKQIYLRGRKNTEAVLDFIKENYDISIIETFIVTGSSAGALAALQWIDYIKAEFQKLNPKINFMCIADSGFFIDVKSFETHKYDFRQKIKNFLSLSNMDQNEYISKRCLSVYGDQPWKCFFSENVLTYIQTPTLVINSLNDYFVIEQILDIYPGRDCFVDFVIKMCSDQQLEQIEQLSVQMEQTLQIIQEQNPYVETYLFQHAGHVFTESDDEFGYNFFTGQDVPLSQVVGDFVQKNQKF